MRSAWSTMPAPHQHVSKRSAASALITLEMKILYALLQTAFSEVKDVNAFEKLNTLLARLQT